MKQTDSDKYMISFVAEMESVRNEWTEIYQGNSVKPHYLSFEYVMLWYSCFALPDQIKIFRIVDNGTTIGFLPLVMRTEHGLNVLKSLTNFHCMHSGPLVRSGYESKFSAYVYDELFSNGSKWDVLQYDYLYSFSETDNMFLDHGLNLPGANVRKQTYKNYVIILGESFEAYLMGLDQKTRRNYNLSKNRSIKAGISSFRHYEGPEAKRQWPELVRLEDMGWKGESSSSLKRIGPDYQRYYDGLIELLSKSGTLRMFFWLLDGRPIAGGVGYFENDVFHWWKAGYDPAYHAMSPSNLLLFAIIDHMISEYPHVKKINLFTGDFGYKHRYCNEEAYCSELTLYNKTLPGIVACYFNKAKTTAKNYALINKTVEQFRKLRSSK